MTLTTWQEILISWCKLRCSKRAGFPVTPASGGRVYMLMETRIHLWKVSLVWLSNNYHISIGGRNVLGCLWTRLYVTGSLNTFARQERGNKLDSFPQVRRATYGFSYTSVFQTSSSRNSRMFVALFPLCPCPWAPRTWSWRTQGEKTTQVFNRKRPIGRESSDLHQLWWGRLERATIIMVLVAKYLLVLVTGPILWFLRWQCFISYLYF